jgi:anti-sigma-K factor RskA
MFVAAYDPDRRALIITSLAPRGADPAHAHQLWLIPADGKPRSLGMVEPGTSRRVTMEGPMAPMVTEGAALAISVEPPGGSPKDAPSGPVAATGRLSKI